MWIKCPEFYQKMAYYLPDTLKEPADITDVSYIPIYDIYCVKLYNNNLINNKKKIFLHKSLKHLFLNFKNWHCLNKPDHFSAVIFGVYAFKIKICSILFKKCQK